jgi:hypothetical protein
MNMHPPYAAHIWLEGTSIMVEDGAGRASVIQPQHLVEYLKRQRGNINIAEIRDRIISQWGGEIKKLGPKQEAKPSISLKDIGL